METRMAVADTQIKNLQSTLADYWNDVKSLRVAWTTITIFIIGLIFGGLIWLDNKQETKFFTVMNQLSENNVRMERVSHELVKINNALTTINNKVDESNSKR